jgi:hypothetical protein
VRDNQPPDDIRPVAAADQYGVNYVGMDLKLDGFAVEAVWRPGCVF